MKLRRASRRSSPRPTCLTTAKSRRPHLVEAERCRVLCWGPVRAGAKVDLCHHYTMRLLRISSAVMHPGSPGSRSRHGTSWRITIARFVQICNASRETYGCVHSCNRQQPCPDAVSPRRRLRCHPQGRRPWKKPEPKHCRRSSGSAKARKAAFFRTRLLYRHLPFDRRCKPALSRVNVFVPTNEWGR